MMEALHSLFYFIIAIAILVTFHEFGHYWVARKAGVKVLRFSVGFGKIVWTWKKSADATEFVISAIPMGGYVKMVDEREGEVKPEDLPYAFNRQPLLARTAIVAAGPVFNLMLAVLLFWVVFMIGETGMKPIIGDIQAGTLAAAAGLVEKDEIVSVNQKPTPTWAIALDVLYSRAIDGDREIDLEVRTEEGTLRNRSIVLDDDDVENPETLHKRLGLNPWMPVIKPVIGRLVEGGAAEETGLLSGDSIVSADGEAIQEWRQWVDYVQARPDKPIRLLIERNGMRLNFNITPRKEEQGGKIIGKIGAGVDVPKDLLDSLKVEYSLPPVDALVAAFEKTGFYSLSTLKMMGKMFTGHASVENLSGPISIAQYAGQSAEMGFTAFVKFLGLISVSLGVLNLMPIPVLDGGHLLFYGLEAIKGSPLSEKAQLYFQQLGMFLLMSLMVLAMYLDIGKFFQH